MSMASVNPESAMAFIEQMSTILRNDTDNEFKHMKTSSEKIQKIKELQARGEWTIQDTIKGTQE